MRRTNTFDSGDSTPSICNPSQPYQVAIMPDPILDLTGARILIVDDVPANLDVLSQSLEDDGYNVLVATNGEMALEVASKAAPDLILLDVMMPVMDGFETCRRLKQDAELSDIPVIFLTARAELEGILEGFRAGGLDYISKPFQKDEVLMRIRTHLERARLALALADLNAHLEEKVRERTAELRQRLLELECKDRIAQHMLSVHTLEETLHLVLDVISRVVPLDEAFIYLVDGDTLSPAAGISGTGALLAKDGLVGLESISEAEQEALDRAADTREPVSVSIPDEDAAFAAVPILRNTEIMGLLRVKSRGHAIPEETVDTLTSFALQAAVAIRDAQIQADSGRWREQLDQAMDFDAEIETPEQLEDFASDGE